ncbi:MAG: M4 family metallopeptidase [Thioploca sp.]|nr:M4 family metallopeptidase [Thioploca sp.]
MNKHLYFRFIKWLIGGCYLGTTVSVTAANLNSIQPAGDDNTWSSKIMNPLVNVPFSFISKDSWRLDSNQIDKVGTRHKRFQQTHRGIPVFGYRIATHERDEVLKRINGVVVEDLDSEIKTTIPKFSKLEAFNQAKTAFLQEQDNSSNWLIDHEKIQLVIYIDETSQQAKLAYYVNFFAQNNLEFHFAQPHLIIDALDGTLLKHWDGLNHETVEKVGTGPGGNIRIPNAPYYYGTSPYDFLEVTVSNDRKTCRLETADVKTTIFTYFDADNPAFAYPCFNNTAQAINGAFSPLNDAHYFGQKTFDLYRNWYGINILPFKLQINVVYWWSFENALWWNSQVYLGDGLHDLHPLVSMDFVAHEISHGFTEQNSNLIYKDQSGGINEAFSDMAGETAEFYAFGNNDWNIGAYLTKKDGDYKGKPIRSLCDPHSLDNIPNNNTIFIDHADEYQPGMDVHYSSGVFNKAFCILAHKTGWDIKKAFEVMIEANRYYWPQNASFQDAACGVELAAENLGYNVFDVYDTFLQVGVAAICGVVSSNPTCLATYSNETQQATIPCLQVPLYTDINGKPLYSDSDGQPVTALYSAVLDMPFGFTNVQVNQASFLDWVTQPSADQAEFIPASGILDIPSIYLPAHLIPDYQDLPVDKLANCHVTLQQFIFPNPGIFNLNTYSCSLGKGSGKIR